MKAVWGSLPLLAFLLTAPVFTTEAVEVGEPIPEFTFRAFDGSQVSRAGFSGRPVVLIFWNTWCPNCMRELPEVKRLHKRFGPEGAAFLAVNTALNDSESRARSHWEKSGYGFPGGYDRYFEIGQAFGVLAVPTVFLIDADGVVRYKQAGLPEDIEERLHRWTHRE